MERVAVIGGKRSAFVRAFGKFADKEVLDLSMPVVEASVEASPIDFQDIEELIFSSVLLHPRFPNLAREIVLRSQKLSHATGAHFISNNCISGLVAATFLANGITTGRLQCGVAGGVETMSRPSLGLHPKAEEFFLRLSRSRSLGEKLAQLTKYRPSFLAPVPPSPKEPSTGLTMGQHCEIMAKEFQIAREDQDRFALQSHQAAAAAAERGFFAHDIVALGGVDRDDLIRKDSSLEKLSTLKPVFDRSEAGTLTAGNSSALTDGASAVVMMAESQARKRGIEPLGFIEDVVFRSVKPSEGLLMAPVLAVEALLAKNSLNFDSVDRLEVHEAFAAQVLCNLKAWREGWNAYPQLRKLGELPVEKMNVNGGSLAVGHPFAATGGRLILSALRELREQGASRSVISVCAAGAMGCAMLVTRE